MLRFSILYLNTINYECVSISKFCNSNNISDNFQLNSNGVKLHKCCNDTIERTIFQ